MSGPISSDGRAPRAVVILKVDTLGDLILFSPALQCLQAAWPQTRLVAVIRRAYLDLAPLLVPNVEWIATTLDPFGQGPGADPIEVTRLRDIVCRIEPDIVVAATSRRNWLEGPVVVSLCTTASASTSGSRSARSTAAASGGAVHSPRTTVCGSRAAAAISAMRSP
jgi:hypothetical protein